MNQIEIADHAKRIVKDFLREGLPPDWPDEALDYVDYTVANDIFDEVDSILEWLAERLYAALTGRR